MPVPPGSPDFQHVAAPLRHRFPAGGAPGYGLKPSEPDAHPALSLERCIEAAQRVLSDTMSTSNLAPWIFPPYRSAYRCLFVRAILNIPAAVDAGANAGGLVLAQAQSTIVPITVLTPSVPPGFIDRQLLARIAPDTRSKVLKLRSWGITVANAPDEALEVIVRGGTAGGVPSPPNPSISSHPRELQQDAHAIVTEDKAITVEVRNLTQAGTAPAALLILFGFCFWEFPVDRFTDDSQSTRLRGGWGAC